MEPELLDLVKFLVEYLILYPVAFDLLNGFLYQLLSILPLSKLLNLIRDKTNKVAVNVKDREKIIREDLSNFQQAVASSVLTHHCIRTESQISLITSDDQKTCTTENLGNHHQAIDSTVLTHRSPLKEIQEALDTILKSPQVAYAINSSAEGENCENDSSVPNSGMSQSRITAIPFTNFTPGYKSQHASDLRNVAEVLHSEQTRTRHTSPLSSYELTNPDQLGISAMESESGRALSRTPSTLPFSNFSPYSELKPTGKLGISTKESDSERVLPRTPTTLQLSSFSPESESILENMVDFVPQSQSFLGINTINSSEYKHLAPNEANDYNLQVRAGHASKKLRSYQVYKHKNRLFDTNSVRQTLSTDMVNFSESTPACGLANVSGESNSTRPESLYPEDARSYVPNMTEDLRPEQDAGYVIRRSDFVYSTEIRTDAAVANAVSLNSSETPSLDGIAMVAVVSRFKRHNPDAEKVEVPDRSTLRDSILEDSAAYLRMRSGLVYNADERLEQEIPMEQTPTDASANSRKSTPTDELASAAMVSGYTKTRSYHLEDEILSLNTVGDSRPGENAQFNMRRGRLYSVDGKLQHAISIENTSRVSPAKLNSRKVRRIRSMGDFPSPKRRCCLKDWYGDRYRRRCEEQIPEVVQRYGRPASFVISHFSSTMEGAQTSASGMARALTSRKSAWTARNSAPTSRNLRNVASTSTHPAPISANSVFTSRNVDSTYLPHLYQ